MRRTLTLAAAVAFLLALALPTGCNNSSQDPVGSFLSGQAQQEENGLSLQADPSEIVIDLGDPGSPTDPNNDNKRYEDTKLTAEVLDEQGEPMAEVEVTFSSTGGALASAGNPVTTNAEGLAGDTLRVYEDDPEEIEVTVTEGERSTTITIPKTIDQPNRPPVADAGEPQQVYCDSSEGATVTLDGSASTDEDSTPGTNDDIETFDWYEDFELGSETYLGEGETIDVTFGVGLHTVTLKVTDTEDATDSDETTVEVIDNSAPVVRLELDPGDLWPPNHKMVDVHANVIVADCSPVTITLLEVYSNEPDNGTGDGNHEPDIMGADTGTEDYDFQLRAERSGNGSGRIYTIRYHVVDDAGYETTATAYVTVPHDQGH
jgi:hypothetical protein